MVETATSVSASERGTHRGRAPRGVPGMFASAWAPVGLALFLALISIPLVAGSFVAQWSGARWSEWGRDAVEVTWPDALVLASAAALTSALLAGSVAGLVVRAHPKLGGFLAVAIAWPVGIGMLSVTAAYTSMDLGIVGGWCETTCDVVITNAPASSLNAYAASVFPLAIYNWPIVLLVGVPALLLLVRLRLTSRTRLLAASVLVIAIYATVHLWSILLGGAVAFACLAMGAGAWMQALVKPTLTAFDGTPVGEPRGDVAPVP